MIDHVSEIILIILKCFFAFSLNFTFNPSSKIYGYASVDLKPNGDEEVRIESIPLAGRHSNTQTNKPLNHDNWGLSKLLSWGD